MDPLAAYAAVVATASVGWQVYSGVRRSATRVEVEARMAILALGDGGTAEAIMVRATNHSEHAIRVSAVGLDLQERSGRSMQSFAQPPGATIPGRVGPHDSGQTFFRREEAERSGLNVFEPVTAWVTVEAKGTIRSKPERLLSRG